VNQPEQEPVGNPIVIEAADPRLRIMISSTTVDLPEHRQEATDAVNRLGHTALVMEHGSAEWESDAIKFSLEKVEQAQVYLGIFALRYGYIPEDPICNPHRLSITELEYRHAVKLGIPTLIFLARNHPFTEEQIDFEEEKRAKLKKLKAEVQGSEICGFFDSPAKLREEVLVSVQRLQVRVIQPPVIVIAPRSLPRPPELYAVPEYILTNQFIGRSSELERLDRWARSSDAIMVVEGIGGLGKSALTWEWTITRAQAALPHLAGRVWWSFYEKGTSMVTFVRHALAYLTGQDPEALGKDSSHYQRGQQLLAELRRRPHLLVLDGFERVLTAYHRLDKAQIPDDRVDEGLRDCVNPPDGELLTQLLRCSPSKILISTRLFPSGLEDRGSHRPIAGVAHHKLNGLSPRDALALMRHAGVTGDETAMLAFADQFGRHSLLLRIVCGMVADYRRKPHDFDTWRADPIYGGGLKLSEVELKQRYTHILHFALAGLDELTRKLLCRIAVISENATYDTLAVLNPFLPPRPKEVEEPSDPSSGGWSWRRLSEEQKQKAQAAYREAQGAYRRYQEAVRAYYASAEYRRAVTAFDAALKELENRGLLQWDREANRYEMHPVVRGYVGELLEAGDRTETFHKVRDYFASLPPDDLDSATELAHLNHSLEIYRCFVGAGMLDEAAAFFRGKVIVTLFFAVGAHAVTLELLKPLFRNDLLGMPCLTSASDRSYFLNVLGGAYDAMGCEEDALIVFGKTLQIDLEEEDWSGLATGLRNLSISFDNLCRRAEGVAALSLARELSEASKYEDGVTVAVHFQMSDAIHQGRFAEAEALGAEFCQRPQPPMHLYRPGDAEYWPCVNKFCQGKLTAADWQAGYDLAVRHRNVLRQYLFLALRAQWDLGEDRPERALEAIDQALQITNKLGTPRRDYHDLRAWALARLGRLADARAELQEGEHLLFATEAHLVLGERDQARACALNAYRRAWGEGPPYIHWYELERSQTLLRQLGEPEPQLPPFDPSRVPPIPWEQDIRAVIQRLRAEREKQQKDDAS
jgi:tetratricopeptide (TPR) repeat protein